MRKKWPRGAPKYTYGRGIYKALKKMNLGKNEWYDVVLDRVEWRHVVSRAF